MPQPHQFPINCPLVADVPRTYAGKYLAHCAFCLVSLVQAMNGMRWTIFFWMQSHCHCHSLDSSKCLTVIKSVGPAVCFSLEVLECSLQLYDWPCELTRHWRYDHLCLCDQFLPLCRYLKLLTVLVVISSLEQRTSYCSSTTPGFANPIFLI